MAHELLSIRLSADGLSFWTGDGSEGFYTGKMVLTPGFTEGVSVDYPLTADGCGVEETVYRAVGDFTGILQARDTEMPHTKVLYGDTLAAAFIPAGVYRPGDTTRYLDLHGLEVSGDKYAVCSKEVHGTVAMMVLPKEATAALGKVLGEFDVLSPLQYNLCAQAGMDPGADKSGKPVIRVYASPLHCYLTVFDNDAVTYAESLRLDSAADLIYYIDWAVGKTGITHGTVVINGHRSAELASVVSARFKKFKVCG